MINRGKHSIRSKAPQGQRPSFAFSLYYYYEPTPTAVSSLEARVS